MGYIFTLPVIVGMMIFFIPAIVQSFIYSFQNVSINVGEGGLITEFIRLDNYNRAFNIDVAFKEVLIEILRDLAVNVPVILIFSFVMANILNQKFTGRTAARAVFFIPVIIGTGIVARIEMTDMLQNMYGAGSTALGNTAEIENILDIQALFDFIRSLGMGTWLFNIAFVAINRLYYILINSGVQILIFLSALQSVPIALYEASYVEGCSAWESFWKITLPIVSPIMLVCLVYTVINSFLDPTSPMTELIHNTTYMRGLFGYGAAMTWMYLLSSGFLLVVAYLLVSRFIFYYDK